MESREPLSLLGNGVYSFADAAKYTRLKQSRIREWFRNREDGTGLFRSDFGESTDQKLISFHDLIESYIAGQMRDNGVTLSTIRKVHSKLQSDWNDLHPFCRPEFRVGGKDVFYVGLDSKGQQQIFDALTKQMVFVKLISPFLKRLDYGAATAIRWRIAKGVEIDPKLCWGQPVATSSKIPTYILSNSFHANGKQADAVARWFEVTKDDVLAAVRFEKSLVA